MLNDSLRFLKGNTKFFVVGFYRETRSHAQRFHIPYHLRGCPCSSAAQLHIEGGFHEHCANIPATVRRIEMIWRIHFCASALDERKKEATPGTGLGHTEWVGRHLLQHGIRW